MRRRVRGGGTSIYKNDKKEEEAEDTKHQTRIKNYGILYINNK